MRLSLTGYLMKRYYPVFRQHYYHEKCSKAINENSCKTFSGRRVFIRVCAFVYSEIL